jgi:lysozyme
MQSTTISLLTRDLERDEGRESKPYRDTTGHLTIGVGHNLDAEGLCKEAIDAQLAYDVKTKAIGPLNRFLPWFIEHPENVQRALANLMFNLGPTRLLKFHRTLGLIRTKRYNEAADALLDSLYARQVGDRAKRVAALLRSA